MCGIAGGLLPKPQPPEIAAVLTSMQHRGPDSNGTMEDEHVWLAAVRLAIQDLSNEGAQPFSTTDKRYTIVFNGEIYNHRELRKELQQKGHAFHSGADTETLLHAFAEWGEACLARLSGIFAFAVWDAQTRQLFIARDGMGVKPLYYYWDGKRFAFASELKSLLPLKDIDRTLKPEAFYNYLLLLYSPDDRTPFRNIHKLMPGHCLSIKEGEAPDPRQWQRLSFRQADALPGTAWLDVLEEALLKAVEKQLISDAPIGFLLSGGLDSSLLTAMAHKITGSQSLHCFTLDTGGGMAGEGFGDDAAFAQKVATHLGIQTQYISDESLQLQSNLDETIWHLDEPQADPAAAQVGAIARAAAAQGIKVLLGGAGADDIFSGYRRHQALYWKARLAPVPEGLLSLALYVGKSFGGAAMKRRIEKLMASRIISSDDEAALFFWMKEQDAAALFSSDMQEAVRQTRSTFHHLLDEVGPTNTPLNRLLLLEQRSFLPHHNLNYLDKMTMAAGVEGRVPYLDEQLVSLANSLPPELKMRGRETKYLLRQVAAKYLPLAIIHRPKTGFGAPLRGWMSGANIDWARERLMDKSFADWNIFKPAAIESLISRTAGGGQDGAYTVLSLLSIESWLRQFGRNSITA